MFTVSQLIAHGFGDYVLQSSWMANEKTKSHLPALIHALVYGLCFLPLRPSWSALAVIVSTHFVIDRWRLARYVCWAKNWIAPFWQRGYLSTVEAVGMDGIVVLESLPPSVTNDMVVTAAKPRNPHDEVLMPGDSVVLHDGRRRYVDVWWDCKATGYGPDTPPFLAVWLLIIVDNLMHIVINGLALACL